MKMNTKYPTGRVIKKHIWAFLLATVLIPVASVFFVRLKTAPKDYEKYALFVGADVSSQENFENSVKEILPEDKKVTVYYAAESDSLIGTMYQGYSEYSDILILSKKYLYTFTDYSLFVDINSLKDVNTDNPYKTYGLHLDKSKDNIFNKYIKYLEDDYYLLVNKKSVHLAELIESGGKTNQTKRVLQNNGFLKEGTV